MFVYWRNVFGAIKDDHCLKFLQNDVYGNKTKKTKKSCFRLLNMRRLCVCVCKWEESITVYTQVLSLRMWFSISDNKLPFIVWEFFGDKTSQNLFTMSTTSEDIRFTSTTIKMLKYRPTRFSDYLLLNVKSWTELVPEVENELSWSRLFSQIFSIWSHDYIVFQPFIFICALLPRLHS